MCVLEGLTYYLNHQNYVMSRKPSDCFEISKKIYWPSEKKNTHTTRSLSLLIRVVLCIGFLENEPIDYVLITLNVTVFCLSKHALFLSLRHRK